MGAGYWLDTYDADHPFTEFEHEVALRSWLMLPPIPDLPEEPCVCGETTPGQMHAMRCKVVRRAIAQRPPARAHRGVSRGGTQGGDGTGPVGDNTIDEENGLCGHHGTNYNCRWWTRERHRTHGGRRGRAARRQSSVRG